MPYKSKKKHADYMKEWRKRQKQIQDEMKRRLREIDKDFHNSLFGPEKRRRRKPKAKPKRRRKK